MHNNWEELIPYYIAGSLPKGEASRLERHIATCDECRKSLDEWKQIAGVVRDDAASQLRDLPPLSPSVLQVATAQATGRRYQNPAFPAAARPSRSYRSTSITLVAAVFTVILIGGLLTFMLTRTPHQGAGVALLPSPTATPQTPFAPSPTALPTEATAEPSSTPLTLTQPSLAPTIAASPGLTPQIIVIEPSATPVSPTPTVMPPTVTSIPTYVYPTLVYPTAIKPPTRVYIYPTAVAPTPAPSTVYQPQIAIQTQSACAVQVADPGSVVNLYSGPDTTDPVIKTLAADDQLAVLAKSDTGWYRVQYEPGSDQSVGWVQASLVTTSGNCDTLPVINVSAQTTATPTIIPAEPLVLINAASVTLRSGPSTNYSAVGTAHSGESYDVQAQSGSWYRITLSDGSSAWVSARLVQLSPADALIPQISSASLSPTPTALPSSTPAQASSGTWSQTMTVTSSTCTDVSVGTTQTTSAALTVSGSTLVMSFAEAGGAFTLMRAGQMYVGGYATAAASVSVSLAFTSATSYSGSAVSTQSGGCTTQSAWSGSFVSL